MMVRKGCRELPQSVMGLGTGALTKRDIVETNDSEVNISVLM